MKLFMKKLMVLLLLCALTAGAANLAFYLVKGSLVPANVKRFLDAPKQIQVANLGSSHGQNGFSYVHHPELAAVNLAFGYQTLDQDERVLENYIDRFTEGATLYIPVSSFSLIAEPSARSDILALNRRFYYFMRRDLIIDFSWREWLAAMSPGLFYPSWLNENWNEDEFDEVANRTTDPDSARRDAETTLEGHILMYQKDGGYALRDDNIGYLTRIVGLCKEHGVTPVLITTPFLREYNDIIPADFLSIQLSFLDSFAAEQGIAYLDFSRDSRFIDRYDLFINSTHLNGDGAVMFTDLVLGGSAPTPDETKPD